MEEGARFFDDHEQFAHYQAGRHRADGPNETLEKPVFLKLLGAVKGRRILDLGGVRQDWHEVNVKEQ